MQLNTQASWVCAGTWLWAKIVVWPGVEPGGEEARRDLDRLGAQLAGSCGTVIACRSTMQ